MNIIDGHVNVTEDGRWGNTQHDASISNLLRQMDAARVDQSLLLPIRTFASNAFIGKEVKNYSDRFWGLGNISVNSFEDDIKEIQDLGLKGVKFHPRAQLESPLLWDKNGVYAALEEAGLPVMICGWMQSSTIPMDELSPMAIDRIAKKYPNLTFVIGHMGGHRYIDGIFCARSNKNVYIDNSYFNYFFADTSLEDDFFKLLPKVDQKVIFGTDFPEVELAAYVERVRSKATADTDLDAVFSGNVKKAFKL